MMHAMWDKDIDGIKTQGGKTFTIYQEHMSVGEFSKKIELVDRALTQFLRMGHLSPGHFSETTHELRIGTSGALYARYESPCDTRTAPWSSRNKRDALKEFPFANMVTHLYDHDIGVWQPFSHHDALEGLSPTSSYSLIG
jgi:hypothetical protein